MAHRAHPVNHSILRVGGTTVVQEEGITFWYMAFWRDKIAISYKGLPATLSDTVAPVTLYTHPTVFSSHTAIVF